MSSKPATPTTPATTQHTYTMEEVKDWLYSGLDSTGGSGGVIGDLERLQPSGELQYKPLEELPKSPIVKLISQRVLGNSPHIEYIVLSDSQLIGGFELFDRWFCLLISTDLHGVIFWCESTDISL